MCDAVEINSGLVRYLRENFNGVRVQHGDFMEWQPAQYYSRIIMNPPFSHGQDIRHILRAFSLLRPGGRAGCRLSERAAPAGEAVTVF
ncbi:hypothetical protein BvCmsKKP061_05294 [Escherichia coli]|uniref:Uncharacterized protein n=1 Tax=Escherichia coli TaxID=562 RepID=A0A4C9I5F9_ECOLX|nr:hypothetical protein BvCmsKKP061_05294 [Escherichia coli]